ncbi:MAG: diacylglycerol kinase family protein [Hyphomicrobiales bacterium]
MTSGVIINPYSCRRNRRGLALAERLEGVQGVSVAILERFSALPGILQRFAGQGVDTLFISSGDGTVHAIQTELAERNPFAGLPRLAILPHGTTNMTAADLGVRARKLDRQLALIGDSGAARTLKTRPTVKVANPDDGRVRHGMFLGTGGIWRGVQFCQDRVHATGLKGDWATGITLVAGLASAVLGRVRAGEDRLDRPYHMRIEADGERVIDALQVVFLATTLDRLILGTRPFWGGATAPLRATTIAHPPPSLRCARAVLYGEEERDVPAQCRSFAAHEIAVSVGCAFVMDGEIFDGPDNAALRIETGPEFTYLCSP